MATAYEWRGAFTNQEVNALHAEAFNTRVFDESEWNWVELVHRHSLGWVVARQGPELVGFVNVLWDGLVHAWLQDVMVAVKARGQGIGTVLVNHARDGAEAAGCEYLHVDFEDDLRSFYFGACGFTPTNAGLLSLPVRSVRLTPLVEGGLGPGRRRQHVADRLGQPRHLVGNQVRVALGGGQHGQDRPVADGHDEH